MKNSKVIDKILRHHPDLSDSYNGCDCYKCGNPEAECTGIATALVPTVEVIKKVHEQGCNLLIVHEPLYYSTPDYTEWRADFCNTIYEEKKKLLEEYGMTIWRDHDHMHAHQPDGIFTGVIKYLGWEQYYKPCSVPFCFKVELPERTVRELRDELVAKLNLNGLRYIGRPEDKISKVAFVGHLTLNTLTKDYENEDGYFVEYGTRIIQALEEEEFDVILPGEIIEWTVPTYIRDAIQLGKNKAMMNLEHFNWEELGMKYARDWIEELVGAESKVVYIPCGDMYRYL